MEGERRPGRPEGVVLVELGQPEDSDRCVAEGFAAAVAVPRDGAPGLLEEAVAPRPAARGRVLGRPGPRWSSRALEEALGAIEDARAAFARR
jgi:hypothetical protein